jgi:2,4-dienoyl-CoA reductase (NADPH2)
VTLFEAADAIGGQLNLARVVPGKSEFDELLRYFRVRLQRLGVQLRLGRRIGADEVVAEGFDEIVLATGVTPRVPELPGIDDPKVVSYVDVLSGRASVGRRVAIIGAGGIGFDVAEYLLGDAEESRSPEKFLSAWSVDRSARNGGLDGDRTPSARPAPRRVHMFQRKRDKPGTGLGKTTGWILKARLHKAGVEMTSGAQYTAIDDAGLHYVVDGEARVLPVDNVVICAGQDSDRSLLGDLASRGIEPRLIGGADVAAELDAARAIEQAVRLAAVI